MNDEAEIPRTVLHPSSFILHPSSVPPPGARGQGESMIASPPWIRDNVGGKSTAPGEAVMSTEQPPPPRPPEPHHDTLLTMQAHAGGPGSPVETVIPTDESSAASSSPHASTRALPPSAAE